MNQNKNSTHIPALRYFLYSLLTGAILILCWPPRHAGVLVFAGFVPLLYVLDHVKNKRQAFAYSFTSALLWAVGTMYWEAGITTMHSYAKILFFIPSFFLVALFMTLPLVVWKGLSNYINRYVWWLSFPVLWAGYEFLTAKGELAMTWLNLEFGLSYYPKLIRFSEYAGAHGVAFVVMSVNGLLYLLLKHRKAKNRLQLPIALLSIIVLGIFLTDILANGSSPAHEGTTKKVAIVQPNWTTFYKADKNAFRNEFDTLQKLTLPLINRHTDLIVCSESFIHHQSGDSHPVLADGLENDTIIKMYKELSGKLGSPILTGIELAKIYASTTQPTLTAHLIRQGYYYDTYNAAILISSDKPCQVYVKNKLCPFTERFPFLSFFSFFNGANAYINRRFSGFATIENQGVLSYSDMRIATAICWENSFPDYLAEEMHKNNANMLVEVSSNFSLGEVAANIDEAYAIPLAVKMQCPIIRCANTGISCFIDKDGNIQQATSWNKVGLLIQDVELTSSPSFFIKHGDLAGIVSFYISLLLIAYSILLKLTGKFPAKEKDTLQHHNVRKSGRKK